MFFMVVGEVVNGSSDVIGELIKQVGSIGLWLQALGVVVLIYIIFGIVQIVLNRKKKNLLIQMNNKLDSLEKKVDSLIKKK